MVSAQLLAYMRRTAASFMTDTCTIERVTGGLTEIGTPNTGLTVVATNVPCRVIMNGSGSNSSESGLSGMAESLTETYKIELATTQTVDIDYKITVSGVTYDVIRIETALTDDVFVQVTAIRRR